MREKEKEREAREEKKEKDIDIEMTGMAESEEDAGGSNHRGVDTRVTEKKLSYKPIRGLNLSVSC